MRALSFFLTLITFWIVSPLSFANVDVPDLNDAPLGKFDAEAERHAMNNLELNLKEADTRIVLSWSVPEVLTKGMFFIERSTGDGDFAPVGIMRTTGEVSPDTELLFTDKSIAAKVVYTYRLRKQSASGAILYSPEISTSVDGVEQLAELTFHDGKLHLLFYNTEENTVFSIEDAYTEFNYTVNVNFEMDTWQELVFEIEDLKSGSYVLRTGKGFIKKFIVE